MHEVSTSLCHLILREDIARPQLTGVLYDLWLRDILGLEIFWPMGNTE